MKKIKLIKNSVYFVAFALMFLVAISLIAGKFGIGGVRALVVQSGSMEPTIPTGSVVVVFPSDSYQKGDIITFKQSGRNNVLVTHRIEGIEKNSFVTKGDANEEADGEMVPEKDIIGKTVFSLPFIGRLVGLAQTKIGFLIIVIIPAVAIIYSEILSIKKQLFKFFADSRLKRLAKKS